MTTTAELEATETCPCGASITVRAVASPHGLERVLKSWRADHHHTVTNEGAPHGQTT